MENVRDFVKVILLYFCVYESNNNNNYYLYFVEGTNLDFCLYVSFSFNVILQAHYVGLPVFP
jgi:hypothetical protein